MQPLEAGQSKAPTVQRRDRIDANTPFALGRGLVDWNDSRIDLDNVQQVIAIADPRQAVLLLLRGQPRHGVDLASFDPLDVATHSRRQWRTQEKGVPGSWAGFLSLPGQAVHQPILTEGLPVEEDRPGQTERWIEFVAVA